MTANSSSFHPERVAAVILAGGASRRMGGGDKTLLRIGGQTILARIVAALALPHIAISANGDAGRFAEFGLPVLSDGPLAGQGPLAGVLAGLDWAAALGADALLTVPSDTPFLPSRLAERLWPPPACAASGGRQHPTIALWPISCREQLRIRLGASGPRHVRHFAATIDMRTVDFPVHAWDPFLNINTPDDVAEARGLAATTGTEGPA